MTSTSLRLFNTHIKIASQKRNTDRCNVRKLSPLHKKRLTSSLVPVLLCDNFFPFPFFFNQFTSDYETLVGFSPFFSVFLHSQFKNTFVWHKNRSSAISHKPMWKSVHPAPPSTAACRQITPSTFPSALFFDRFGSTGV